ncbi:hypothetical protein [Pseudomonas azotoformans]|uniref:DUF1398 domain-containing protein n=1 Tax=Pseudomonas azotoformans TaxID=47878 RepID=A0A127I1V1_PSEAZ|nr:hypothetical protein [Pseudomonas azotoformans]AMN80560.1 hypothetical protein AYR47_20580 [Pseudomonas azotoformans]
MSLDEVTTSLASAGVESYWVDYRACRVICYMRNGDVFILEVDPPGKSIPYEFSNMCIQAAVNGLQRGELIFPDFTRDIQAAGCVGYAVWILGKVVTYHGRKGEQHVDHMPGFLMP